MTRLPVRTVSTRHLFGGSLCLVAMASIQCTIDRGTHDRYMRDLWRLVAEEVPITYLNPLVVYRVAHRKVKGFQEVTDFVRDIEHLWIEEDQ